MSNKRHLTLAGLIRVYVITQGDNGYGGRPTTCTSLYRSRPKSPWLEDLRIEDHGWWQDQVYDVAELGAAGLCGTVGTLWYSD
jgi:hypothetical protein